MFRRPPATAPAPDRQEGAGMSSVLLFGASGFIGAHVRAALERDDRVAQVTTPGRDGLDLLDAQVDQLAARVHEVAPDIVINCTGRLDGTASQLIQANT